MLLPTENNKALRIAILGIYHESNSFVEETTTLADFQNGRWLKGGDILNEYADAHHEIGGAIEVFRTAGVEIVPIFYAETTPGGIIEKEAYDHLVSEMMQELQMSLPVSACFIVPHGAAVAENHPDMDGDWISMLRQEVGPEIPIVGTLDPHANVSETMTSCTDGLFPYRTNPHIDQRETGKRAGLFLLEILNKQIHPIQVLYQAPLAISIHEQNTSVDPCKSLYELASELSLEKNILHVNIAIGFPYADVHEMGTSVIIITDNDPEAGELVIDRINNYLLQPGRFNPIKESFQQQWIKNKSKLKPILLLDIGDNIGGGGPGNSTYLLDQLDQQQAFNTLSCIYDPEAVRNCMQVLPGEQIPLEFGRHPETGKPYHSLAMIISFHQGVFEEKEPRHGGQLRYDMGATAVVQTKNGHTIILNTRRVPPFSLEQIRSCNIDPQQYEIIIAKGVIAPIAAYNTVCPTIIQANSPGQTQADMTRFIYNNRRKPLYPFEDLS